MTNPATALHHYAGLNSTPISRIERSVATVPKKTHRNHQLNFRPEPTSAYPTITSVACDKIAAMERADDIRAKQQQAAAEASDLRSSQAASFASLKPALRAAAPEIARLCRQVRLKGDGRHGYRQNPLSNLLLPRWNFQLHAPWRGSYQPKTMTITIYGFGGWRFKWGRPQRRGWDSTHIFTAAEIQSNFAAQVERKAIEQARR